jgi:isoleucyl-tRNA synthetase
MPAAEIRRECRKYAEKYVELQKRISAPGRLRPLGDPYLTMSARVSGGDRRRLRRFPRPRLRLQGPEAGQLVLSCRTALAEAEVEYEDALQPVHLGALRADVRPGGDRPRAGRAARVYGVIWTTTPWTIPANMAIASTRSSSTWPPGSGRDVYIVAAELLRKTAEVRLARPTVLARFSGAPLETRVFRHPFLERDSAGMLADHVTLEQGTGRGPHRARPRPRGLRVGQQYGIDTYCPVDAGGRFFHAEGADGRCRRSSRQDRLGGQPGRPRHPAAAGGTAAGEDHPTTATRTAGAATSRRSFRATEQWFIGMDRNNCGSARSSAIRQDQAGCPPGARSASPT